MSAESFRNWVGFWCAIALMAIGLFMLARRLLLHRRCDCATTAEIVDARRINKNGSVLLTVRAEIRGETHTMTEKSGASPKFRVGDMVEIRYNPDRPEDFYVTDNHSARRAILLCLGLGLAFLIMMFIITPEFAMRFPFGMYLMRLRWMIRYRWLR